MRGITQRSQPNFSRPNRMEVCPDVFYSMARVITSLRPRQNGFQVVSEVLMSLSHNFIGLVNSEAYIILSHSFKPRQ